jgi:hypothetical protein
MRCISWLAHRSSAKCSYNLSVEKTFSLAYLHAIMCLIADTPSYFVELTEKDTH